MVGSAENGPIDLVGVGGNVNLKAENGPISIKVGGNSWQDGQLDARTTNGPLSLNIPEGFQSGFKVESRRYSPMSCQGDLCQQARKTWDDDVHRIEFGGAPVLNMSTVNGPVEVRSGMAQEAEE